MDSCADGSDTSSFELVSPWMANRVTSQIKDKQAVELNSFGKGGGVLGKKRE